MNKFSIRAISAAALLGAALAGAAFAQDGVRTGPNTNIGADVRANAAGGVTNSADKQGAAVNADTNTRAGVQASDPGVRGAVARTGDRVGSAVKRGTNATTKAGYRAKNSVDGVARRADRRIQNALPNGSTSAGGSASAQGSNAAVINAPSK
ncbi:MAG: hypothetical protein M3Q12_05100 [Pseudomonadota bacterium]|uniref:hypothetical protein n=1 Tax=Polaromonas sp. TaxID=1869339 RepID=UPI0017E5682D|nr:hypothetical protein [Polaromonas sp.]MBA3594121.1 hypothetical protein [Polaromonas sp.]MDQ3271534.1 hypothetical protein [Pseudomonadota bacterium]